MSDHASATRQLLRLPVPDGAHAPHLMPGEFAVIDKSDREIVVGQVFLVQQSTNQRLWLIKDTIGMKLLDPVTNKESTTPSFMLSNLYRQDINAVMAQVDDEQELWIRRHSGMPPPIPVLPIYFSDGPIYAWALQEKLIGRVIGVLRPAPQSLAVREASHG